MVGSTHLSRRKALASTAARVGECLAMASLLSTLQLPETSAAQIAPDDPRILSEIVTVPTPEKGLQCYLARPAAVGVKRPAVVVLHDYWGMRPHFQDVARRAAVEGFVALAPDYASRFGGTPDEKDPAREMMSMEEWRYMIADTEAAMAWLGKRDDTSGKMAAVGFGWGGSAVGRLATRLHDGLDAGVVFYGRVPPLEDVPAIKARLLLNYAADDSLVDPDVPAFVDALKKAGVTYEMFTYDGAQRAFDDDRAPAHFAADAAKLAWSRTVAFLQQALG
jgi:carboxymethylenebutenolidase